MTGKILAVVLALCTVIAGGAMYYLQVYGFYYEVPANAGQDVQLVTLRDETSEPIQYDGFQAIDADSSPIRYRACFTTPIDLALLTERYVMVDKAEPRNAPGWFDCFDASALGAELEQGTALAFMGQKNVHYGVDRIVAITQDGRGFAWNELNDCGEKAYDGTVVGEECPPYPNAAPESN